MSSTAIMILAVVALVAIQVINAVRMELWIKDINAKIDDVNVYVDRMSKHTAKVVELAAENSARWGYVNTVAHEVHSDVKDLHIRMIDIIKRYINYKEPLSKQISEELASDEESEEEREEEEDD